jgi:hypothetical protein
MFFDSQMTEVRSNVEARPTKTRSRITNGKELLSNIDGRSSQARRYRDLFVLC